MKPKTFGSSLFLILLFVFNTSRSQTCATLEYPANNQNLVSLFYDNVDAVPTGRSNGVELKWRQTNLPMIIMMRVAGQCCFNAIQSTTNHSGIPFSSDTSLIVPVVYNTTYEWFLTSGTSTTPCSPASVFKFTTGPAPMYCKPGCGNVYDWNFFAFRYKIPGENNNNALSEGFACQLFNPAGAVVSELSQGKTYPMHLWYELVMNTTIWIDFNDNGYFEDNERLLYRSMPYLSPNYWEPTPAIVSFQIPGTAPVGTHRIRIASGSGEDACYGALSTGDGFVKIIAGSTNYGLAQSAVTNTCQSVSTTSITPKANNSNDWLPLVDASGNILASVKANGNDLGAVTVNLYSNSGPIRTLPNNTKVLDRSVEIKVTKQPVTPVDVRLYFSEAEFNALKAADNTITDIASLNISKFSSGCGETKAGYNFIGATTTGSVNGYYYIQFTTTSFSDFYIRGGVDAGLPVQLINAKANREGKDVLVKWETVSEQNNNGFDIEVSGDGSDFQTIGFVKSKSNGGNSNVALPYVFRHENAPGGNLIYRLKQLDKDGKASYSQLMKVNAMGAGRISIVKLYPNPSREKAQLELHAEVSQAIQLEIVNSAGIVVKKLTANVNNGQSTIWLDLSGISTGIYLVSITDKEGRKIDQVKLNKL